MVQDKMPIVWNDRSFARIWQPGCRSLLSLRPVALRPRFSAGLPFH